MFNFLGAVVIAAIVVAVYLAGCGKSSELGGRAGDDTFRLVVPSLVAGVKQGELLTVRVQLNRGATFKQGVKLDGTAPAGITVEAGNAFVKPEDKGDIQLTVSAAKDAPLGEHKIQLKGTPDKGEATNVEFKINVTAK